MIALAGKNGANISKQMKREELIKMGIQSTDLKCIGERSTDTFLGFPFNIASYATLAKILEEITLFVALEVEGNLKCVHFYDNQFEAVETLLKEILMCTKTAHWRFLKNSKTCVNCLENQITLDVLFNLMSIDMFKLSGYTSDKAISVACK
jgi:thymidylate synthase